MLGRRVCTSIVGILYIFLMIYIGGWFFKGSVLVGTLILMHEFYNGFLKKGYKPLNWLGYIWALLLFYSIFVSRGKETMAAIVIIILSGLTMPIFLKGINIIDILISVFAVFYPGMMTFFLIPLAFGIESYGINLLVLAFVVTWATDTFAYFLGKRFGKRQLSPSISPNKTVEGSLGGLAGGVVAALVFGYILKLVNIDIPVYHFAIIGFLGSAFSQLGDLCASSIKRFCNVKDFGKVLPGHGGLLDRLDSLLFTMPLVYLYYLYFLV